MVSCRVALVAISLAGIWGCTVSKLTPVSFPALYQPEGSGADLVSVPACAVFRNLFLSDERTDKRAVGTRSLQEKPDRSDIFIEGDVESWFEAGVKRALVETQFPQDPAGKLDLVIELESLRIAETAYRNSTFEGKVVLEVGVKEPGGESFAWSERFEGASENYGRPGKKENYQETVNHALDRAIASALNSEHLRAQLCDGGAF
jgi:hypothetical protein